MDVGGKGPAAALLHEITEKNAARKFMLLPLCVHAEREQAERKLIGCDQSHAQDEASGAGLCVCVCVWLGRGGAHSQSHTLISSRVVVAARLKILTPHMLFKLELRINSSFRFFTGAAGTCDPCIPHVTNKCLFINVV